MLSTARSVRPRSSWYRRRRTIVSAALLVIVVFMFFVRSVLADGTLLRLSQGISPLALSQQQAGFDINTTLPPIPFSASAHVVRIDSGARDQYYTDYQWRVWAYSSCSGI